MTDGEVWLYLISAFGTGLGLGWWLFGGARTPAEPSSASIARERAAGRTPAPPEDAPAPDSAEPIPPVEPDSAEVPTQAAEDVVQLRAELMAARRAAQEAERRRITAEEAIEAGRLRQAKLQANLDRTRQARATLEAEVEQARRDRARLERSTPPQPSAPSAVAAAVALAVPKPAAPRDLERDAPTDLAPPKAPIPPFALAPSSGAPSAETAPTASFSALSKTPSPRIPPPPAPKRSTKPRGPVEVLFGPLGGVPLTTNARSIPWELTIRLLDGPDAPTQVRDVQVTLRFDLEDEGVAINGRRRGPLTVGRGGTVTSGRPLHVQVSLSTGVHSDAPEADRPAAVPGEHPVVIVVQYTSDRGQGTPASVRFSARIPVSAPTR